MVSSRVNALMELLKTLAASEGTMGTVGLDRPYDFPLIFASAEDEDAFVQCFADTVAEECRRIGAVIPRNLTRPIAAGLTRAFAGQAERMEERYAREVEEDSL